MNKCNNKRKPRLWRGFFMDSQLIQKHYEEFQYTINWCLKVYLKNHQAKGFIGF